jgi:hypothetical protein
MTKKFNVGDVVKRLYYPHGGLAVGDEATVVKALKASNGDEVYRVAYSNILDSNKNSGHYPDNLELVRRADAVPPPAPVPVAAKDGNPKEIVGASKLAFHLVPDTMGAYAATAFFEGASKYGAYNWRVSGVRASTYKSAAERHIRKWFNGQNEDPTTGVHHLANAMACLAIILDAEVAGKLNDDRPPSVDLDGLINKMADVQGKLKELHKDCNPKHHTEKP